MPTNTVRLHRVFRAAPEKVYRAFLDADAMAKWLPPHGFTGKVHHVDAKVGGTYKMSFTNFTTGGSHSFGGTFSTCESQMATKAALSRRLKASRPRRRVSTFSCDIVRAVSRCSCAPAFHAKQAD